MDNLPETTVPYSAKAVKDLFQIEQGHRYVKDDRITLQSGSCWDCWKLESNTLCPTLNKARRTASRETIIAVALLLELR